jgi:hypothetical protein
LTITSANATRRKRAIVALVDYAGQSRAIYDM